MRILYITFFCKPFNSIPSLRTNAFLEYLPEEGIEVDVLTRHYDSGELAGNSFESTYSSVEEMKEPYRVVDHIIYTNFEDNNEGIKFSEKLPSGVRTIYNYFQKDLYHKNWIKYAIHAFEKELKCRKYDFIVASYHPFVSLHLASLLSKKHKIPWIADFRDSFIGVTEETKVSLIYKKLLLKKVLKNVSGVVSVSKAMNNQLNKYGGKNGRLAPKVVVNNGVDSKISSKVDSQDQDTFKKIEEIKSESTLLFVHTGTIYEGQDIEFFLNFIQEYNKKHNTSIRLVCVGLTKNQIDFKKLTDSGAIIFDRVSNTTSIRIQQIADVLIIPAWYPKRYTGFVAKIFEYIHSGNHVICSPYPVTDLREFLVHFKNVFIASGFDSMENYIQKVISNRDNKIKTPNNHPMLFRKYWIKIFAEFLKQLKKTD